MESLPAGRCAVYAFNGGAYMNYSSVTDANGQVFFTLPQGDYTVSAVIPGARSTGAARRTPAPCPAAQLL